MSGHTSKKSLDPILRQKAGFNVEAFMIRAAVFFGIWSFLSWKITSQSLAQDKDSIAHMETALPAGPLLV